MNIQDINLSPIDSTAIRRWRILIKDWTTTAQIGVWPHEKQKPQEIRINIICEIEIPALDGQIKIGEVVCYDQLLYAVKRVISSQHFPLVENLVESIIEQCLKDFRIKTVSTRVEKTSILSKGGCVGVEITRKQDGA